MCDFDTNQHFIHLKSKSIFKHTSPVIYVHMYVHLRLSLSLSICFALSNGNCCMYVHIYIHTLIHFSVFHLRVPCLFASVCCWFFG